MKDLIVQLSLTLLTVEVSVSVEYYDAMKSSSTPHIYNHQTDQDHYDYPEDHQDGSGHMEEELEPLLSRNSFLLKPLLSRNTSF